MVRIHGLSFVAGLDWLPRGTVLDTAREARKVGSVWCAYDGDQTGYAGSAVEHEEGMAVLAVGAEGRYFRRPLDGLGCERRWEMRRCPGRRWRDPGER